jgi:hypothetical protein
MPSKLYARVRDKNLHTWLPGVAGSVVRRLKDGRARGTRHLLFALCDHYEPQWGQPSDDVARARVATWLREYPLLCERFRDSTGRPPRHSFFFPGEQYDPHALDALAGLVKQGLGEVELHLHHDNDNAQTLTDAIVRSLDLFASHGHLARTGNRLRYAFIHGNWCLANARRDGRYCGVDNEVELLWNTGCYADFTFPAAPNESQPRVINQIYWPAGDVSRRRAADYGERARVGEVKRDRILFIQGPLALTRRNGSLKLRVENGDLQGSDPPSAARLKHWVSQKITVDGRPDWVFVKVHTHGAPEKNAAAVFGPHALAFHEALQQYNDGTHWRLHYVTAREMYNVAIAAMAGKDGDPSQYFDYELRPPPAAK